MQEICLYQRNLTISLSSILYVILLTVSPTLLKSRITPLPLNADVLVALGNSTSTRKSNINYIKFILHLDFRLIEI